jgi:hypothetical protein
MASFGYQVHSFGGWAAAPRRQPACGGVVVEDKHYPTLQQATGVFHSEGFVLLLPLRM